jgi:hypothetical protein
MPKKTQMFKTSKRRKEVIQLREAGATWSDIAVTIEERHGADALPKHWGKRYACQDFHRALDKLQDEVKDRARSVREMELRRLDRMLRGIWSAAVGGKGTPWNKQRDAIDRVLKIQKRRASLLGLDAPSEVDLTTEGEQIQTIDFRPPAEEE